MDGLHNQSFSPSKAASPQTRTTSEDDSYLSQLLAEHRMLDPCTQEFPISSRILNQEILKVSRTNIGLTDFDRLQDRSLPSPQMSTEGQYAPSSLSSNLVKRTLRINIPVDEYPNFNFVGRLLGPRGSTLKRVEEATGCRVHIRGKGSIKDPETVIGKPGYEHLNDNLHVLILADLPPDIVDINLRYAQELILELAKPVAESEDYIKKQQLSELALLRSSSRENSTGPSGSGSPFNSNARMR